MEAWSSYPEAVQNLFNPGFCSALLARVVRNYDDSGMDVALAYVSLPLILHAPTRLSLPRNTSTSLAAWREGHAELAFQFPNNARALRNFVDAAIVFGTWHGLFALKGEDGKLAGRGTDALEQRILDDDRFAEVSHCLERARFVGRWLARAGSTPFVFSALGARP